MALALFGCSPRIHLGFAVILMLILKSAIAVYKFNDVYYYNNNNNPPKYSVSNFMSSGNNGNYHIFHSNTNSKINNPFYYKMRFWNDLNTIPNSRPQKKYPTKKIKPIKNNKKKPTIEEWNAMQWPSYIPPLHFFKPRKDTPPRALARNSGGYIDQRKGVNSNGVFKR